MVTGRYRTILQTPGVRSMLVVSVLARLPLGFETLGIVLLVRAVTGSFAIAGIAAAATNIVAALSAAPIGRLVDRHGQRRVLMPTAAVNATALAALATAGAFDGPAPLLVACAALSGIIAPVSASQRAILADIFPGARLQAAYALETVVQEAVFTLGPLIATTAAALSGPPAAVYAAAILSITGTTLFANHRLSRAWQAPDVDRRGGGAMRVPAIRLLFAFAALTAFSIGGFEVAMTAFARQEGNPNSAGAFLAIWAIGSAAGGLWYGSRPWRQPPGIQIGFVALTAAAAYLPAAAMPNLWAQVPAALLAGATIAPLLSLLFSLIGMLAPAGMLTEAFSWLNVAFPTGFAGGAAVSGAVADGPGARVALIVVCAGVAIGGVALVRGRNLLAAPAPSAPVET